MPVTAKLSREFYQKFGDKVVDELVNWFNEVDATYRSDLKSLNQLNFGRFDAKVEQRFAEADVKLERRFAESDARWEQRFAEADVKLERRLADVNLRLAELRAEMQEGFGRLEGRMDGSLHALKADLLKWMFGAWATLLGATIALIKLV